MPCTQSDILTVYQTQFFAKLHKQIWLQQWEGKDWMQCRLFQSSYCYWQSFSRQLIQMHSQTLALLLEILFKWIIWFDLMNQWAIQRINQVSNWGANQPMIEQQIKDWNVMLSFLISFGQNEESIVRKYARAEGVTLPPSKELCPSGGSNSPAAGARSLTQFGEKGKNGFETWLDLERKERMNLSAHT